MRSLSHRRVLFPSRQKRSGLMKTLKKPSLLEDPTMVDKSFFSIPEHFTRPPPILDDLVTATSSSQKETVAECLPHLNGVADPSRNPFDFNEHGIPRLSRQDHIDFLHQSLEEFPAAFVAVDASRPWMVYWALMGLFLLGEDVTQYRDRSVVYVPQPAGVYPPGSIANYAFPGADHAYSVIKTFSPMKNSSGGLGGGHGQYSHLAGTYAAVLSLALVGGDAAYELIDRESMWKWLGRLKQSNGGFQVCEGGEEDVRGAYCAMVVVALLDLPSELPMPIQTSGGVLSTFKDGLEDYLANCQTFEGGISGAPGNEAHGAYAFCALACLCLINEQDKALQCLDVPSLVSWLSSQQYAPEGGFAGRTNKLVDGCYSHWVGGCWPLLQGALIGPHSVEERFTDRAHGSLYSTDGLARYILSCCQSPAGGLKDKPSKRADSYHTCYTLAGLSSVQHVHYYLGEQDSNAGQAPPFRWKCQPASGLLGKVASGTLHEEETLQPFHPLFVIPHTAAQKLREWSVRQSRPWSSGT